MLAAWVTASWLVLVLLLAGQLSSSEANGRQLLLGSSRRLQPSPMFTRLASSYLSNSELADHLKEFAQRCSKIAKLSSFGKSVNGSDLWVLELSARPGEDGPEPQVKYVGNIHGDEPSGRQLLLLLAERICADYTRPSMSRQLVESVRLFLIPTLNPDGYEAHRRENKVSVDLNRNFPDPIHQRGKDLRVPVGPEQPETLALMNFTLSHRFVASLALHEGALVANYPMDGYPDGSMNVKQLKQASTDDPAFMHLSGTYARLHTTMSASKEFPGGVTNGAQWYPLYGGMQDWNFEAANCMEVTLELNDQKWPMPPRLAAIWAENEAALVQWPLKAVLSGVRGKVSGMSPTGVAAVPLAATISVAGNTRHTSSSARWGDYLRVLPPGTFTLTVAAPGYVPVTSQVIILPSLGVVKNWVLEPVGGVKVAPLPVPQAVSPASATQIRKPSPGPPLPQVLHAPPTPTTKPVVVTPAPLGVPAPVSGNSTAVVADKQGKAKAGSEEGGRQGEVEDWQMVERPGEVNTQPASTTSRVFKIASIVGVQVLAVAAFLVWRRRNQQQAPSGPNYTQLPIATLGPGTGSGNSSNHISTAASFSLSMKTKYRAGGSAV